MEDTFASLDSSADPVIRQEALSRERVLQKLLILDRLPQVGTDSSSFYPMILSGMRDGFSESNLVVGLT